MYDYAIIGSGPAGLTMALHLSKYNKKVLLIEKENTIGGCHRVRRVNGLFTEHGPRVVIGNYFSFNDIIKEFGKTFGEMYIRYNSTIMKDVLGELEFYELFIIAYGFFTYEENKSLYEFATLHNFTKKTIETLDNLCRTVDGGTIKNFTLKEFYELINQNFFYNIYQPRLPNDVGLFRYWLSALEHNKVDIMFNTEIKSIITDNKINYILAKNDTKIKAHNYIFAIPPQPMLNIIKNSTNNNMFGPYNDLEKWEKDSRYLVYIPITFHWSSKVNLKKDSHLTISDYGIVYIVMSDYMDFNDDRSKTVITCSVKITDRKSVYNNKTADECSEEELIDEVFRQLKEQQPNLVYPDFSLLSPGMYKQDGKWETVDTAYFYTKKGYKSNKSIYNNLFWVGCHNGNSNYSFTAMETAIENAISLLHDLIPESKKEIVIHKPVTITNVILTIFILSILYLLWRYC